MEDIRKQRFLTIETKTESNLEEMQQKIRQHRKKIAIRGAVAAAAVVIFIAAAGIYYQMKEYKNYEVTSEIERSDSDGTQYVNFSGNILRYNNDGAFYADLSDQLIWNQAFEMQNPSVKLCETYAVIADLQGTQVYIMDTSGKQGELTLNRPIEAVCVAGQGTIAVLTQADGTSYLELYNKSGESLASGEIHVANSGYPLDIALSKDANKLAVSILDVGKGKAGTTVAFYNFGSVGQNEIDNIVATYSYEKTVIREIEFISNDRMIAFGDNRILFFEGTQKPKEAESLKLKRQVKSVFFDSDYFGLVFAEEGSGNRHKMEVYDMKGKLRLEQEFDMPYQKIEFLENHEICVREEYKCEIYTMRGVKKFSYQFNEGVQKIISGKSGSRYTFILDGVMQKVKLK